MRATRELPSSQNSIFFREPLSLTVPQQAVQAPSKIQVDQSQASALLLTSFLPSNKDVHPSRFKFEVTFLHKVYRVQMPHTPKEFYEGKTSLLDSLISLLRQYFKIESSLIKKALLVDVHSKQIIESDSELLPSPERYYYLAFIRSNSSKEPSLNKNFLWRKNRRFSVEVRPYNPKKCEECGEATIETLHLQRNFGSSITFSCPFLDCQKVFPRSCDLVFHFQVESDARPYNCEHCMKSFRRPYLLTRHMKSSHSQRRREQSGGFDCSECGISFKTKRDFTQHWKCCSEQSPLKTHFERSVERTQLQSMVEQIHRNFALISKLSIMESNGLREVIQREMAMDVMKEIVRSQVCLNSIQ